MQDILLVVITYTLTVGLGVLRADGFMKTIMYHLCNTQQSRRITNVPPSLGPIVRITR